MIDFRWLPQASRGGSNSCNRSTLSGVLYAFLWEKALAYQSRCDPLTTEFWGFWMPTSINETLPVSADCSRFRDRDVRFEDGYRIIEPIFPI